MSDVMRGAIKNHCRKYKYSKEYEAYWLQNPFCEICGYYSTPPHHLRTRGAGGTDESGNLIALCTEHHNEAHTMGVQSFARKYAQFYDKIFVALDIEKVGSVK